jgi:hypothetical protein
LTTDQKVSGLNPDGVTTPQRVSAKNWNPFLFLVHTKYTQMIPINIDELHVSLYHLFLLRNRINDCLKSLNDMTKVDVGMPKHSSRTIRLAVMAYIDITVVAYFDEYDRHTNRALKQLDKIDLLKNIKQVRKDLEKKWPDSKVYRNEVLAHYFRDKNGKSLFDYDTLKQYKVPTILKDKFLIYAMIGDVTALLADEYPDFFKAFKLPATPKK